jgi:dihydropteroate synthase
MPVLEGLRDVVVPVSIDTCKPAVMRAALDAGASMVNDVNALQAERALDAVSKTRAAVCLMHKQGTPENMQLDPNYREVTRDVMNYLQQRILQAHAAGIARERIVVDPGFGFGKTLAHNLALLKNLNIFAELGVPLLAGLSRKSMLGTLTGQDVDHRLAASVAAALIAVQNGASIVRVHDVRETVDALKIWNAVSEDLQ